MEIAENLQRNSGKSEIIKNAFKKSLIPPDSSHSFRWDKGLNEYKKKIIITLKFKTQNCIATGAFNATFLPHFHFLCFSLVNFIKKKLYALF